VPTPEERLLSVVHALLHRCYKLPFSNAAQVRSSPSVLSQLARADGTLHRSSACATPILALHPITAGVRQFNSPAQYQSRLDWPMEFADV